MIIQETIPYYHIIEPLANENLKKLFCKLPDLNKKLSNQAASDLKVHLIHQLSKVMSKALQSEFDFFKTSKISTLEQVYRKASNPTSTSLYNEFCETVRSDYNYQLYNKYPLLKIYVENKILHWIDFVGEMFERLFKDKREIEVKFQKSNSLDLITELFFGLSDDHSFGRSVVIFVFESNFKLVYKPRTTQLESYFGEFLKFLQINNICHLSFPLALSFNKYGWVEYIKHESIQNIIDLKSFYFKYGSLLCIIHLLRGTDCHYENVIATRVGPILIDAETLFHPIIDKSYSDESLDAKKQAFKQIDLSVLRTGIVPYVEQCYNFYYDFSALASIGVGNNSKIKGWVDMNTDFMQIKQNVPNQSADIILNNWPTQPYNFATLDSFSYAIIEGYLKTRKNIHRKAKQIINSSAFNNFNGAVARFVFRPTQLYALMLSKIYEPSALRSMMVRDEILSILENSYEIKNTKNLSALIQFEKKALLRGDIPFFQHSIGKQKLLVDNNLISLSIKWSSTYEAAKNKIRELDEKSDSLQIDILKNSLLSAASLLNMYKDVTRETYVNLKIKREYQRNINVGIKKIASIILDKAIYGNDNTVAWIGAERLSGTNFYKTHPLNLDLYNGIPGIWIFFSALNKEYKELQYEEFLRKLEFTIKTSLDKKNLESKGGIGTGLGSLLYSASLIYDFNKRSQSIADSVFNEIKNVNIEDSLLDEILYGTSGLLISLIKYYKVFKRQEALKVIQQIGRQLLIRSNKLIFRYEKDQLSESNIITGIGHGVSGTILALIYLHKTIQDPRLLMAARKLVKIEDIVFNNRVKRNDTVESSMKYSWCHGIPGLIIPRVELIRAGEKYLGNLDIYIKALFSQLKILNGVDHVCCGRYGIVDVLSTIGKKDFLIDLDLSSLKQLKVKLTSNYEYHLTPIITNVFNPGFFQGYSGIGYSLLRINNPKIPSVLMFQ